MKKGECLIMNNKRIMHSRLPFTKVDGVRQFYQAYGNWGLFLNKWKVVEHLVEGYCFHTHQGGTSISIRDKEID